MKKVVALLKNIRPLKLLTVFLAGVFLFFTQACNSGNSVGATTPSQTVPRQIIGEEQHASPNSEVYVPKGSNILSPNEGGMNNFSDVDPRRKGADVKAKAEALKQNAEQNVIDETSNIGENTRRILDKKGDNVEQIGKNLQQNAQETADKAKSSATDFARGTSKGVENIKDNTSDAAKGAARNAQGTAEDAKFNAQRTASKAGEAVNTTLKDANSNAAEKGKQAAENSGNFLEKVGSAIKDAVD
ncbi:hypothetical protein [Scytonema sp. PRP1]|uniref:hypothetical protein n=1 Tax=Scytonema sp. PRP1 TaxID=3120513 RepID=UPI002FD1366C